MTAKTISILNFKGGCTKTSSTVGLGAALSRCGKKVLLVDCDPQGHLAVHLGISHDDIQISMEDVLGKRDHQLADIIRETSEENLWLAPSGRGLTHARESLANRPRRDALLHRAIKPMVPDFDFILIDTPPDEGLLTVNAMYASRYLIIPTPLDTLSLSGMEPLADSIFTMREAYEERELEVLGVVVNRYDGRLRRQNRRNIDMLNEAFGDLVFNTRIRADEEIRNAQAEGQTIFQRGAKAKGAIDFAALAEEVVCRVTE